MQKFRMTNGFGCPKNNRIPWVKSLVYYDISIILFSQVK
jgi:hypothetical protein